MTEEEKLAEIEKIVGNSFSEMQNKAARALGASMRMPKDFEHLSTQQQTRLLWIAGGMLREAFRKDEILDQPA